MHARCEPYGLGFLWNMFQKTTGIYLSGTEPEPPRPEPHRMLIMRFLFLIMLAILSVRHLTKGGLFHHSNASVCYI
jgi:hypothetical protein